MTDSVCYIIDVPDPQLTTIQPIPLTGPTFDILTPSNGSEIVCEKEECHVLLFTQKPTGVFVDW